MGLDWPSPTTKVEFSFFRIASAMYPLVDRANGEVISTIQDNDFAIFQEHLVSESSEDYDFYINEATLNYLSEQGLSTEVTAAFEGRLQGRGMDMGWEKEAVGAATFHTGTVVDDEGQPLGGIRVDLLDQAQMETGHLYEERTLLDWTYSRTDGTFTLETTPESPGTQLRFSGRGDLVLASAFVEEVGEQGEFTVQTITGSVLTAERETLTGVSVQLLNWSLADGEEDEEDETLGGTLSWGDADDKGRFAIPVHLPTDSGEVVINLEILSTSGESLFEGEYVFDPAEGFEIGELVAKKPSPEWGDSEDEVHVEESIERPFEHPLS